MSVSCSILERWNEVERLEQVEQKCLSNDTMTIKAILLDIEGTTTPIDFVHMTLFPYAKAAISDYIRNNFSELRPEIEQLAAEHAEDSEYAAALDTASPESVGSYLKFLIDRDRKSTPLKSIQGKIWKKGYESGELLSEVFEDVPPGFARWKAEGRTVAIYSSGSVLAQQLLFRYTYHGDLTPFISNYFDTNIGGKKGPESYGSIAKILSVKPNEILFVSDMLPELDAAHRADMETALSIRPGNTEIDEDFTHRIITSFDALP